MSLERAGATHLLLERRNLLNGLVLELGVGIDPYESATSQRVTVDINRRFQPDVVADAHSLPFRKDAFDSVLASQVFEHLHSPWIASTELSRVLSGYALVAVPFLYGLHEEPHDYFRYTEWGLRRIFQPHFDIVEVVAYGGRIAAVIDLLTTPMPSSTRARRVVRRLRKAALGPGRDVDRPAITRWLRRRPAEFPCGYVVVLRTRSSARGARSRDAI